MLRDGTYVRESDGAKLLFYSWETWNNPSAAVNHPHTSSKFNIVWDTVEQSLLYQALGMANLEPGESVEIIGGKVA